MKVFIKICVFLLSLSLLWFAWLSWNLRQDSNSKTRISEILFLEKDMDVSWAVSHKDKNKPRKRNIDKPIFSFSDGVLHAYKGWEADQAPYASAYTKEKYADYRLELKYKWGSKKFAPRINKPMDAGIIFHVYGLTNTPWPSGLEYQLLAPDESGMLVIVRTRAKVKAHGKNYATAGEEIRLGRNKGTQHIRTLKPNQTLVGWNEVLLEVIGSSGKFYHNGKKVMEFSDAEFFHPVLRMWKPLVSGRIVLQAEGAEIFYKDIKVIPINSFTDY